MFHNMLQRIIALCVTVILLITVVGGVLSVLSARRALISERMDALVKQAREIAFLAEKAMSGEISPGFLEYKAEVINTEFDACILLIDRSGHVLDALLTPDRHSLSILQTLDQSDLTETFSATIQGEEVQRTFQTEEGTVFTASVPWYLNGETAGTVLIHTGSQIVQSEYRSFILQIVLGFAAAALIAIICSALYTKGVVKPLTRITRAAESMSRGILSARAEVTGVSEVRQLAGSFNVMAEKMEKTEESRREFVANVSHELRSPVTSIHGFVEGMLDGTIPQEEQTPYLQIVFDETNRMKRLISDLLQLSRMDKGVEELHMTVFDVNELLRRVLVEHMRPIEEKNIAVHLNLAEEARKVHADRDKITQVANNIIDNALKYLPNGGNLTVRSEGISDEMIAVTIENDGDPIAPADRNHLFERFYKAEKAHTSGGGTGLGLSICKQIMDLHRQTITITEPKQGAGFRFTLARADRVQAKRLNPGQKK